MRKVIADEWKWMSLDGVVPAPGSAVEDRAAGSPAAAPTPYFDGADIHLIGSARLARHDERS